MIKVILNQIMYFRMEEPISLDTSLQIVASMKYGIFKKIQEEQAGENDAVKIAGLERIYDMYSKEEKMLYGSDGYARLSIMDKVLRLYSPIIKKQNG